MSYEILAVKEAKLIVRMMPTFFCRSAPHCRPLIYRFKFNTLPLLATPGTRNLFVNAPVIAAIPSTVAAATGASPLVSVIAVVVGWLVIAGSIFRSVPQIARIIKKKR
jgi:ABC-type multidrug transport system permease subunit